MFLLAVLDDPRATACTQGYMANFSRDQSRLLERFKEHAVHSYKDYFDPSTHVYNIANTLYRSTLPSMGFLLRDRDVKSYITGDSI